MYRPIAIAVGDSVLAELRSTVVPAAVEPSTVELRMVEFEDGPFLELTLDDATAADDAVLWHVTIDGHLRGKFSYLGGTHGTRLRPEQYTNGITVVLYATDEHDTIIQATDPVLVR